MNEQTLIKQAQNGVTSSFSKLVTLYQTRLYQYLLARCYNSHDADDVLQETFISAFKYIQSYQVKWKFSTWLFTIAKRLIKKQHILYYRPDSSIDILALRYDNIEVDVIEQNNIWCQVKIILKADAYDVLWFFYVEGLRLNEIAHILQRSQSWVKISLYRSKKKLACNKNMQLIFKDFLLES